MKYLVVIRRNGKRTGRPILVTSWQDLIQRANQEYHIDTDKILLVSNNTSICCNLLDFDSYFDKSIHNTKQAVPCFIILKQGEQLIPTHSYKCRLCGNKKLYHECYINRNNQIPLLELLYSICATIKSIQ